MPVVPVDDPGTPIVDESLLVSVDELQAALGTASGDLTSLDIQRMTQALRGASAAVANYVDRDLASPLVTEQRTFEYDGSGFLDVDDCTAVTAVTFSSSGVDTVLQTEEWEAQPYGAVVQTYLLLPAHRSYGSPAMGFTRNLDIFVAERGWVGIGFAKVDATWGWPVVPADVKQAVIWTAAEMNNEPGAYRSEAIANYSYSRDTPGLPEQTAIPARARDLLAPYIRYKIG